MNQRADSADEETILDRFIRDSEYRKSEVELRKNYITQLQIAKYSKMGKEFSQAIVHAGYNDKDQAIILVSALLQPENAQQFKDFISCFIATVEEVMKKYHSLLRSSGFLIFYFNHGQKTHSQVSKFFVAYKSLPVEYFSKLKAFYLIDGNFFIKSWFWFQGGIQISTLKQKVVYISKLKHLEEVHCFTLQHYQHIPEPILNQDKSHKALKEILEERNAKDPKFHQINQQKTKEIIGLKIEDYDFNEHGIPICVDALVSYFERNIATLCLEGIFRKSASKLDEKKLEDYLVHQQYEKLFEITDAYVVAGVIKSIFDKMTLPLISYELYAQLVSEIKTIKPEEQVQFLSKHLHTLSDLKFRVFSFITGFLRRVAEFEEKNKMTTYNMSVVFAPCFFRPATYTFEDLKDAGLVVNMCKLILDNYEQIFPNEKYIRYLTFFQPMKRSNSFSGKLEKN